MSIYYYGQFIGRYNIKQKQTEVSSTQPPVLVGDIVKNRADYDMYRRGRQSKTTFTVRHYQDA